VAEYMSSVNTLLSEMLFSSPIEVMPAWIAGPRMNPMVWNKEKRAI